MLASGILGLGTGTLLGLLGGGGSIVAVPILVYVLGMETKSAIATSLVIVGLSSFLAAASHYRKDHVLVRTALLFGASGGAGSFLGAKIANTIPDVAQLMMFASAMAIIGILMLNQKEKSGSVEIRYGLRLPVVLSAGGGAGLLTGLLGVGGGFIIVPALTVVLGLPMKQAVGTSLLVIGMNSVVGAIAYGSQVQLSSAVIPFAIGTLSSAPIAGHFAQYIEPEKLKTGFAGSLLMLSTWMIARQIWGF